MRYRDLIDLPESNDPRALAQKQAKDTRQKANAHQAISDARSAQNNALRRLQDEKAKANKNNDPGKAADATRAYTAKMNRARTKSQNARARLSKPSP